MNAHMHTYTIITHTCIHTHNKFCSIAHTESADLHEANKKSQDKDFEIGNSSVLLRVRSCIYIRGVYDTINDQGRTDHACIWAMPDGPVELK